MRMRAFTLALAGALLAAAQLAIAAFGFAGTALAAPVCLAAGTSGMTAVVVATSGQFITGSIDATGCDLGVYVGPGVTHVLISGATIGGAKDEGILVQDTSLVAIRNNTVTGNGGTKEQFSETKAIEAIGSDHVVIQDNTVTGNAAGIGIADDGADNPSGPQPGMTRAGSNNLIIDNTIDDNSSGCGIVVAAYNPGAGVNNNAVMGNSVSTSPAGIVVAADMPNTTVTNNLVLGNTSTNNGYSGIIVHSNAPGDVVSGIRVIGNRVSGNEPYGILVAAGAPTATLNGTVVVFNSISNEPVGIGHFADTNSVMQANFFSNVGTPVGVGH